MKKIFVIICSFLILYFGYTALDQYFHPGFTAIYYYGTRGQTVTEIQSRLKRWGYYNGSIDGIYGYKTFVAVKKFQAKNGLKADGVAGSKTLAALGINTYKTSGQTGSSGQNHYLMSKLVTGEARGEPYVGQVAIGAVVLNRIQDPRFPKTIPGVIYQPGAFTAVDDGQINLPPTETSQKATRDAFNGWDPTGGAIYYFNPATATSKWIWSRPQIVKIGKHIFCK